MRSTRFLFSGVLVGLCICLFAVSFSASENPVAGTSTCTSTSTSTCTSVFSCTSSIITITTSTNTPIPSSTSAPAFQHHDRHLQEFFSLISLLLFSLFLFCSYSPVRTSSVDHLYFRRSRSNSGFSLGGGLENIGEPISSGSVETIVQVQWEQSHRLVLTNNIEIEPYIRYMDPNEIVDNRDKDERVRIEHDSTDEESSTNNDTFSYTERPFKRRKKEKVKNGRGITKMNKIAKSTCIEKITIEFDNECNPIGKKGSKMISWICVLGKTMIRIIYNDWQKEVSEAKKDIIWATLNEKYNLPKAYKRKCLKMAASGWKTFKKNLRKKYIKPYLDPLNENKLYKPPKKYEWVHNDWHVFVNYTRSKKFKSKMQDKIDSGEIEEEMGVDVMVMALGKDHPGRLKGCSQYTTSTEYFGMPRKCTNYPSNEMVNILNEIMLMKEKLASFDTMKAEMDALRAELVGDKSIGYSSHYPEHNHPIDSSNETPCTKNITPTSTPHIQRISTPPYVPTFHMGLVGRNCLLAYETPSRIVAHWRVGDSSSGVCHGKPLNGSWKVSIVDDIEKNCLLPILTREHNIVTEAVNSFVAWPPHLVILGKDVDLSKEKSNLPITIGNKKENSKEKPMDKISSKNPALVPTKKPISYTYDQTSGFPKHVRFLIVACSSASSVNDLVVKIPIEVQILGNELPIFLSVECVEQFYTKVEIGSAIVKLWIRRCYDELKKKHLNDVIKFIDPSWLYVIKKKRTCTQITRKVFEMMQNTQEGDKWIIPYNGGYHWILIVYEPFINTIYYLDSMWGEVFSDIKNIMNEVHIMLNGRQHRRYQSLPIWYRMRCPKQDDLVTCGYYVLMFIRITIANPLVSIIDLLNHEGTYSDTEVDEMQNEWTEFTNRFLQL